jgi:hypothetical protein
MAWLAWLQRARRSKKQGRKNDDDEDEEGTLLLCLLLCLLLVGGVAVRCPLLCVYVPLLCVYDGDGGGGGNGVYVCVYGHGDACMGGRMKKETNRTRTTRRGAGEAAALVARTQMGHPKNDRRTQTQTQLCLSSKKWKTKSVARERWRQPSSRGGGWLATVFNVWW